MIEGLTPEIQTSSTPERWRRRLVHGFGTTTIVTETSLDGGAVVRNADIYNGMLPPRYSRFLYYELAIGLSRFDAVDDLPENGTPLDIYSRIDFGLTASGAVFTVVDRDSVVRGHRCLRVAVNDSGEIWVSVEKPCQVLRRVVYYADTKIPYMEYEFSDFRNIEGVSLPFRIDCVEYCNPIIEPELVGEASCRCSISVDRISFSATNDEVFSLVLPTETSVSDRRNGRKLFLFEDGVFAPDIAVDAALKGFPHEKSRVDAGRTMDWIAGGLVFGGFIAICGLWWFR